MAAFPWSLRSSLVGVQLWILNHQVVVLRFLQVGLILAHNVEKLILVQDGQQLEANNINLLLTQGMTVAVQNLALMILNPQDGKDKTFKK